MEITPNSVYTTYLSTTSPKQRQNAAGATAVESATTVADQVTISHAAYDRAMEETKGGGTYDFTKITPKQIWPIAQDLYESGKITRQQHLLMVSAALGPAIKTDATRFDNTPINLIQYSKDRISFLESVGSTVDPQYGYESWKGLLSVLQGMTSSSIA